MKLKWLLFTLVFYPGWMMAQTLTGVVLDHKNDEPLPGATIYIDGTTRGTITDAHGNFSIELTDTSPPVIFRYVGYEQLSLDQPNRYSRVTVKLKELVDNLDEVVLYKPIFTQKQKYEAFIREFLGSSEAALDCKILNPDVIRLDYDPKEKLLKAYASEPIKIVNTYLGYELDYTLFDFELSFTRVSLRPRDQVQVYIAGTTFFKDISGGTEMFLNRRREYYKGSKMHWIRSIYSNSLRNNGFKLIQRRRSVDASSLFTLVQDNEDEKSKWIIFKEDIPEFTRVYISDEDITDVKVNVPKLLISSMGNFYPIDGLFFLGFMGNKRVGDLLPLDYQP